MNIKFVNVYFFYNNKLPERNAVLKNINLEIDSREFIGIIGPSGSGKTTLVQHFTGLLQPNEGKILIDGQVLTSKEAELQQIRRKIGIVFQFPEAQLFEETVYDDIAFGPRNFGISGEELESRLLRTFELVGIDFTEMKNRSPFKLSEGEKRRVAIAGIIAMEPEILVLDEPTACLDARGINKIEQLLISLNNMGKTIVLVSHNMDFVAKLCKRIIVLQQGEITYDGSKEKLFSDPMVLKKLNIEVPRTIRYGEYLRSLGYITAENIFSVADIKSALSA